MTTVLQYEDHKVEVEALPPLSMEERRRLKACERVIEEGLQTFYEVGNALAEIRESRLYRISDATFDAYCRRRWGMSKSHANRLIDSSVVIDNLTPIGVIPGTESQARELVPFEPEVQKAVWQIALRTAPLGDDGKPRMTADHICSVANVLTEVVLSGGMDDGSGEMKPIGILIDAAVTEETYERLMRQKEYVRQHFENKRQGEGKSKQQRSDRSEVEALQEPEIQERLARYIAMITEMEHLAWPPELAYLLRLFQLAKTHAYFQKNRNVTEDCDEILTVIKRLPADPELGFTIAAQELYDWLFDLGYCMSKKEFIARMEYMSQDSVRMALWTDAGKGARQVNRRGALPGIVCYPWKKVWKLSKEEEDDESEEHY